MSINAAAGKPAIDTDAAWTRRRFLIAAPLAAAAASACARDAGEATTRVQRSLLAGRQWFNTPPLQPADVRGKVVLVNFWTYSCINSLRPLPYLRTWADKYRDRGLLVVGVHTPEFAFEKDPANVKRALADLEVRFPVVLDNEYATWRAFGNNAWPGFYFMDAGGRVRGSRLGEGAYEQSERLLQTLLSEARGSRVADPIVPILGQGVQAAPDWDRLGSGETYVGFAKATTFRSPGGLVLDSTRLYRSPDRLALNTWSLAGKWRVGDEFATLAESGGAIAHRFRARDLNLVLAPPPEGRPVRFRVRLDGAAPGADHGFDTDAQGLGRLDTPRMYQLVRQSGAVGERTFQIEFLDSGARAYAFTFG